MASAVELIKYYDTLKKSFDKIQDRADKTTLLNAALRPKIAEECMKCDKLFDSYIDYIKLFCVIHEDKFSTLCNSVLVQILSLGNNSKISIDKLHDALKTITKSNLVLANDLATSIEKLLSDDKDARTDTYKSKHLSKFFLANVLKVCEYLDEDALVTTIQAILRTLSFHEGLNADSTPQPISEYYSMIYAFIKKLLADEESNLERVCLSFIEAFTRDPTVNFRIRGPNYIIFYISSLKTQYSELIIQSMWETFIDFEESLSYRKSCINFVGSFIARASFIDIDRVMSFLSSTSEWYIDILGQYNNMECDRNFNLDKDLICHLADTIFYIITQRYKEFYLDEIARQLISIELNELIESEFNPLQYCDPLTKKRFMEIGEILCVIDGSLDSGKDLPSSLEDWRRPFPETIEDDVPDAVKSIMRFYVDYKIFTINRDK